MRELVPLFGDLRGDICKRLHKLGMGRVAITSNGSTALYLRIGETWHVGNDDDMQPVIKPIISTIATVYAKINGDEVNTLRNLEALVDAMQLVYDSL